MITTFRGRALDWYMKFYVVPTGVRKKSLDLIRIRLIEEFKKPKSESQCITKLKDIKHLSTESVWDFDQRFNILMAKVSFQMSDVQQKEWFIVVMLPHIHIPLMLQKFVSRSESLELAMKLEASPVRENGAGMM